MKIETPFIVYLGRSYNSPQEREVKCEVIFTVGAVSDKLLKKPTIVDYARAVDKAITAFKDELKVTTNR